MGVFERRWANGCKVFFTKKESQPGIVGAARGWLGDGIRIAGVVWTASRGVPPREPDGFGLGSAGLGMHPADSSVSPWAAVCPSTPGLIPRWPDAEAPWRCARPDRHGDAPRTTLAIGRRIGPGSAGTRSPPLVNRQRRLAQLRARPVYPKRGDGVGTSGLRLS